MFVKKLKTTDFQNKKVVLLVEFSDRRTIENRDTYFEMLQNLSCKKQTMWGAISWDFLLT